MKLEHADDALGMRVRQAREQNRVHGAEDRGGRPDAEPEGQDRDRGEPRGAAQAACGVAEVRGEHAGHLLPAGVANGFAYDRRVAHLEPSGAARRIGRQTLRDERVGRFVEIVGDLVGDVAVRGVALREDA